MTRLFTDLLLFVIAWLLCFTAVKVVFYVLFDIS